MERAGWGREEEERGATNTYDLFGFFPPLC